MRQTKAFTMIELSIVILIIGVIVAATLKVRTMIDSANKTVAARLTENSPLTSIEGLTLWLETTTDKSFIYDEIYDGSSISVWNDIKSANFGQANNATPLESSKSPTYTKNFFSSGIAGIKFKSSESDSMQADNIIFGGSELTYFVVASSNAATNNGLFAVVAKNTTNNNYATSDHGPNGSFTLHNEAGNLTAERSPNAGTNRLNLGNMSIISKPVIVSVIFNTTGHTGFVNGSNTNITSDADSTGTYELPSRISLGGRHFTGVPDGFSDTTFGEVIFFNRALKTSERKEVENYLSEKYKIALTN